MEGWDPSLPTSYVFFYFLKEQLPPIRMPFLGDMIKTFFFILGVFFKMSVHLIMCPFLFIILLVYISFNMSHRPLFME